MNRLKEYIAANRAQLAVLAAVLAGLAFLDPGPASIPVVWLIGALQLGNNVRTALLDNIEATIGTAPIMELRSGSPPANCGLASSGTLLAQAALPSDWMAAAANGVKAKNGTWTLTGLTSGTIGYFRIFEAASPSQCQIQGTVTATGGGGDMTVDNTSIALDQVVTVNTFTLTAPNA